MHRKSTITLALCLAGFAIAFTSLAARASEVVAYEIVDEISIPDPLTDQPGDPVKGREVAIDRKKGNCLACHILPIPEQSFHGETGPDLNGVADRYEIGELRLRVVNPKVINPGTMMPAFYRSDGFHRVSKKFEGKTILSAQEVEDLLAYLMTLREN